MNSTSIKIIATTGVAAASAYNHYIKYYLRGHISWQENDTSLPDVLPSVDAKIAFNDRYF